MVSLFPFLFLFPFLKKGIKQHADTDVLMLTHTSQRTSPTLLCQKVLPISAGDMHNSAVILGDAINSKFS